MAKQATNNYRTYIRNFWLIYASIILLIFLIFLIISLGGFGFMPSFGELENPKSNLASEIISADQQILGTYYIENRSNVAYREISPHLINALIATEDIRFSRHSGIDFKANFRVAFGILTRQDRGGGSTITQQLAKNLFPRKSNINKGELVLFKLKEWVTATKLERNYTKEEIAAMYLNSVSFGSQAFGVRLASRTFFNKEPIDLNAEESALLIGILKAPSFYSPVRHPDRAAQRRETVLGQMAKYDFITRDQFDSLRQLPIDMSNYMILDHTSGIAQYFREMIRIRLNDWCETHKKTDGTAYNLYKDGLKIYTTINSVLQTYAEEAVREHLSKSIQPDFYKHWKNIPNAPFVFPDSDPKAEIHKLMTQAMYRSDRYRNLKEAGKPDDSIQLIFNTPVPMIVFSWDGPFDTILSPLDSIRYYKFLYRAALMSVEPNTGFVRAYVGGPDFKYFQYDNVTVGKRQVGSTFKPFLYTLAMQEGQFSPCTEVPNIQYSIQLHDGSLWEPQNTSHYKTGQMISLKEALAHSNNWISTFLMKNYSPEAVITIARKMGVTSDIPAVYSIALGSADLSLYEMVGALNTFVNKGVYIEPVFITRIEDSYGNVLERFVPRINEAMSEETAYLMIELMKGVVQTGTGIRLRYKYKFTNPIAGKTGTTQNQSDGWFIGMTPELVTGIWAGCEDRAAHFRTLSLGQGANTALPIWAIYMKKIYNDPNLHISTGDFEKPLNPISVDLDCTGGQGTGSQKNYDEDEF
ncbi:MAG TPA: transglycosylase domain-containing protein [Bacteroidales bacterium]|nr:transglycosylase domain-containing protein [Bacteroidales bacterium]HNS45868.1 transglycosylase domain-containing protein [Bacteroidales bacterium]